MLCSKIERSGMEERPDLITRLRKAAVRRTPPPNYECPTPCPTPLRISAAKLPPRATALRSHQYLDRFKFPLFIIFEFEKHQPNLRASLSPFLALLMSTMTAVKLRLVPVFLDSPRSPWETRGHVGSLTISRERIEQLGVRSRQVKTIQDRQYLKKLGLYTESGIQDTTRAGQMSKGV
jgi:hypothetical protein